MNNSPTALYFRACDALDLAERETPVNAERVKELKSLVRILCDKAKEGLAIEEQECDMNIRNLKATIGRQVSEAHSSLLTGFGEQRA